MGVYCEERKMDFGGEMHVLAKLFQVSCQHDQVVTQINQPKQRRCARREIEMSLVFE